MESAGGDDMWKKFEIVGKDRSSMAVDRPPCLFVDTTGEEQLRPGLDIDLSHWHPNRTPNRYRADTSTEIALKFAAERPDHEYLVINDHADTDGLLSVFALVSPDIALADRELVAAAAEIGDFSFHGNRDALLFYAALAEVRLEQRRRQASDATVFAETLPIIAALLTGDRRPSPDAVAGAEAIDATVQLVVDGTIEHVEVGVRLACYRLDADDLPAHPTLTAVEPRFDQPLVAAPWLSHRARNAVDRERLQLVSVQSRDGWSHSLWLPQYLPWDTETLWRPGCWEFTGERLTWTFTTPALGDAAALLAAADPAAQWVTRTTLAPWTPGFPIILENHRPTYVDAHVVLDAVRPIAAAAEADVPPSPAEATRARG